MRIIQNAKIENMKVKEFVKNLADKFEGAMFPEFGCDSCGRELENVELHLCEECLAKIKMHNGASCKVCGASISQEEVICAECKNNYFVFDKALSVCDYGEVSAGLVKSLKYNGQKYIAKHLAKMMFDYFKTINGEADVVTFVPCSAERLKERGFNQAQLIAEEFARLLEIECVEMLKKTGKTLSNQASLNFKERQKNIKGTFALLDKLKFKDKNIVLIDDVFTTGATANECSSELLKINPKSVVVLTFAKTLLKMQ